MALRVRTEGLTHKGMKRDGNEDSFDVSVEEKLFMVADGMGGHNSGEIASKIAVETVANFFRTTSMDDELTWPYRLDRKLNMAQNRLLTAVKLANTRIFEISHRNTDYQGMGTTASCMYIENDTVYIGHVGDSRVYLQRTGEFQQITEDHSLLNQTLKIQKLTEDQITNFKHKNVLVRALGIIGEVEVDLLDMQGRAGDRYLICSDGLTNMLRDEELDHILKDSKDLQSAAQTMIDRANANGGNDNITVVLVELAGS